MATEMCKRGNVVTRVHSTHELVRMQIFQALDQLDDVYAV